MPSNNVLAKHPLLFETLLNQESIACITFEYTLPFPIVHATLALNELVNADANQNLDNLILWIHPDDQNRYLKELRDYANQPEIDYFERTEFRIITANQSEKWIKEKGIFQRNEQNDIEFIAITWQDNTYQHDSQKHQDENERKFEVLMDSLNVGFFEHFFRDNRVQYSNSWKRQLGYESYEIEDDLTEWEKRVPADYVEKTQSCLDEHLSGKTEWFEVVFPMRHKKGHQVWILAKGKAKRDEHGHPTSLVATHTDLSIVRELPNDIKTSANLSFQTDTALRCAFMQAPIAMTLYNLTSKVVEMNPKMIELFGYQNSDVTGQLHTQYLHPDDRQQSIETIENLLNQTEDPLIPHVRRAYHKAGHLIYAETRSYVVTYENNDKILCTFVRDITANLRQEASEDALNALLQDATTSNKNT